MLYVFHVNAGRMLTFEMSKALENVRSLKETIERHHGIPAIAIVLLVSGGGALLDTMRVCIYPAGTDTNPIYMFSSHDNKNQPQPWPSIETDNDINTQVDRCLELPATYATVVARAHLAQKIYEMAKEEARTCESLVHDQHLQQQGWAAVVANMEDVVVEFKERAGDFYRRLDEYKQRYTEHVEILAEFDNDMKHLSQIPILSILMENADGRPYGVFDEEDPNNTATSASEEADKLAGSDGPVCTSDASAKSTNAKLASSTEPTEQDEPVVESELSTSDKMKHTISLLDWISASEGQTKLRSMAEECLRSLELFDNPAMSTLRDNIDKAVEHFNREDVKQVGGLEKRLCDLEELIFNVKKIVQDQNEMAQSFQQNQNRANTLGDTSIFPDLCASHRSQLVVMSQNHKKLCDQRRRAAKCKSELSDNLSQRLKFVSFAQSKVYEIDNRLLFYHTSLKRLQKHLGIIEQIHMAPCMYVSAVTEVIRRRMFSSSFLKWASGLSCRLMTIHKNEVMRRQDFALQFEGHFLSTLFPGMDDMPPSYAIEAPSIFDSSLPALTKQDLQELSRFLPELTEKIQLPNIDSVIDFFSSRSVEENQSKSSALQELRTNVGEDGAAAASSNEEKISESANNAQAHLKEGCESETDTEEFEKVGQSPIDRRRKSRARIETCSMATSTDRVLQISAETLTEENLGTTRLEVEKLKCLLQTVYQLSQSSILFLREQLLAIKAEQATNYTEFRNKLEAINRCWKIVQEEARNRERETIQRMTVDHELEMNDLRKSIHQKDDEIQSLRSDNSIMKASHIETVSKYESEKKELNENIDAIKEVVSKLEQQLENTEINKKTAIQEAIDQLEHKHKTDIESLRCRYKLMTSMDRSPSDTSLEKIEKPDMIDIASHEQLLAQAREDFNREKERAIKIAIEEERQRWEASVAMRPQQRSMTNSPGTPTGSHDFHKRILEEKDRQLEESREKQAHLARENQRLKENIQSLTDPEFSSHQFKGFQDRVQELEQEKQQLAKELEKQHHKSSGGVSIHSCSKGDTVIIVYNGTYHQYTVVQNAPVLYFLHAESYAVFNLPQLEPDKVPTITHLIGIVVDKDYCHARKDQNRYRVSRGTRFYRVKVKPLPNSGGSGSSTSSSLSKSVDSDKHSHKKEKSKFAELTRSSSTITEKSIATETPAGVLIDSFAQTEHITSPLLEDSAIKSSTSRDMIDSGVVEQQKSVYKERNISVTDEEDVAYCGSTSASVDDNEQQRLRYQSVCEEEQDDLAEEIEESNSSNTTVNFYL